MEWLGDARSEQGLRAENTRRLRGVTLGFTKGAWSDKGVRRYVRQAFVSTEIHVG